MSLITKRERAFAAAALVLLALSVHAQTPNSQSSVKATDVVVQVVNTTIGVQDLVKGTTVVTAEILNISSEIVTHYDYTLSGTYSDGFQTKLTHGLDDVFPLVAQRLKLEGPDNAFRPANRRTVEFLLAPRPGATVVSATIAVGLVVLADKSVWGAASAPGVESDRKRLAASVASVADELEVLKQSSDPVKAVAAKLAETQKQLPPPSPTGVIANPLHAALLWLSRTLPTDSGALDRAIKLYRAHAAILLEHSSLEGGVQ